MLTFKFQYISQDHISKEIRNLNSNEAMHEDGIPVKILKQNNDISSYIIYHNFNNSIFEDTNPDILKRADLAPAYKNEKFLKKKLQTTNHFVKYF